MGKRAVFCRFWCRNRSRGTLSHGHRAGEHCHRAGDPGEHCHRAGDTGEHRTRAGEHRAGDPGEHRTRARTTDHGPRTTPRSFMRQHPEAPARDSLLTTERLARANYDPGKESAWTNEHKKTPPDLNRTRSICCWFFIKRLTNDGPRITTYCTRLSSGVAGHRDCYSRPSASKHESRY